MTISIRKRSSPCIEELEPRILDSADLSPIAPDAPAPAPVQRVINADGEFSFSGSAAATASTPQMRAQTLVFVDARTPNREELIEDIRSQQSTQRDIQIVVLDRDQDGIKAIGDVLQQKGEVGALHIIGHGSNGKLELGSTRLDFDTLLDNAVSIKRWSDALTQDADILIYGCDVAQTAADQGLVDALARLTGADVGASTDPTGSAALGGDWDLEYLTGEIEEPLIISVDEQGLWDHLLDADAQPQVAASVVSVPLAFEQNVGQLDASVQFLAHGSGYAVALTNGDAILALQNADSTALVKLQVVGKNATPAAAGEQLLESKTKYLIGDQANWRTDIANYAAVSYQNVYDGIDLRYYGSQRQLEYDFIVAAHHDVNSIQLRFDGAQQLSLAENGDLLLTLDESGRTLAFHAPVGYQDGAGGREHVDSRYVINADGTVGFEVGAYDADRALVIDPVLLYGTYFGGTGFDTANGVGVDAAGNVYMTGYSTLSAGVLGGLLNGLLGTGGGNDVFVTKYSANMQSVIYSTYVGGSGDDRATAIAIDANGNAYVTGSMKSSNFPTASAYQGARDGGQDAFVLKLNAAGDAITYSTYLGGSGGSDVGSAIAVDAAGNAYVAGYASSSDFPVTAGAADSTYEGGEAFVSKLNATGNALLYSSFIGGSASDTGYGIAVDGAGNAVVVGETDSNNLLTSAGAYQATYGGGTDAFVVTLNSTGTAFGYSSYLGGSGRDAAYAVALGGTGKIYLTGETKSSNFDVTAGAYQTADPKEVDAFVSIIDPTSSGLAPDLDFTVESCEAAPLSSEKPAQPLIGTQAPDAALFQSKVMIIDDEPLTTQVVKTLLQEAGYARVVSTNKPRDAFNLILQERPVIILLDLLMPEVNGFEILRQIRARDEFRYTPVIMLTATTDPRARLKALELGASDFLTKPVDPSELQLRLRNALAFKAYSDRLADFDPLTGLLNRSKFREQTKAALKSLSGGFRAGIALHIDLDRFKQINDSLGTNVGDRLLNLVARRLERTFAEPDSTVLQSVWERSSDILLSRVSGNAFVAFIPNVYQVVSTERATRVARRVLAAMAHPFSVDGHELFMTASIGIAIAPNDGTEVDPLLQGAEKAVYHAKQRGRNTYEFFSGQTNGQSLQRLTLENQLRQAVERDELVLHFQPKVDIGTGRVVGAEALLRWNHPDLGLLMPDRFIPMAEEMGLIVDIGQWVLRTACQQAETWSAAGLPPLSVAVNVSAVQFRQRKIWHGVRAALERSGMDPERLVLELTESMLMEDAEESIEMLRELKEMGVRIAVDDFGTGYSSFAYLGRFPIDELKIDRCFVKGLPHERENAAIVSAIVALSKEMNLEVVAEGVDAQVQLDFLRERGCQVYQGYWCSKPVESAVFVELVSSRDSAAANA